MRHYLWYIGFCFLFAGCQLTQQTNSSTTADSSIQRKVIALWIDNESEQLLSQESQLRNQFIISSYQSGITHFVFERHRLSREPVGKQLLEILQEASIKPALVYTFHIPPNDQETTATLAQRGEWRQDGYTESNTLATPGDLQRLSPAFQDFFAQDLDALNNHLNETDYAFVLANGLGFSDLHSDVSSTGRRIFQNSTGVIVRNWPEDILGGEPPTSPFNPSQRGPLWDQWISWRAEESKNASILLKQAMLRRDTPPPIILLTDAPYQSHLREGVNWAHPLSVVGAEHPWLPRGYQETASGHLYDGFAFGFWEPELLTVTDAAEQQFAWWASFEGASAQIERYTDEATRRWGAVTLDSREWAGLIRSSLSSHDGVLLISANELLDDGEKWLEVQRAVFGERSRQ